MAIKHARIWSLLLVVVLMVGLFLYSPGAYGLVVSGAGFIVLICLPALLLTWLVRRMVAWRLARIALAVVLSAVAYSTIYCVIFTAQPGTRVMDETVQPFWVPAIFGAIISFIVVIATEMAFKNPTSIESIPR